MLCTLPTDKKKTLYFSVATLGELFYEKELRSIPNLTLFIHITREDIVGYEKGRVETDIIEASENTEWYLCGNPKMVEDTCKKLSSKGFTRIYTEEFN
jgi:NAD(P)H-flavin reductase